MSPRLQLFVLSVSLHLSVIFPILYHGHFNIGTIDLATNYGILQSVSGNHGLSNVHIQLKAQLLLNIYTPSQMGYVYTDLYLVVTG